MVSGGMPYWMISDLVVMYSPPRGSFRTDWEEVDFSSKPYSRK